ncbi:MAG: bifunctional folylpolyglutamate synthase/dihydrofolate synthase [Anaerolineaceae bacterium]|nr:bifunctional folylpolyglutamate synthase/dihydrofolate synthase [Anaerolineaceae bacterium]
MTDEIRYQQALDYLFSFVDYSLVRSLRFSEGKFDLGRMRAFLDLLGNPQNDYQVVHVAGTKGKGSVCALITSGLRAAGYRVGLYTSPHLQDYAERIQVNGQPIDHDELVALLDEIKPSIEKVHELTTFEITTALGFLYFSRQKVQAAVVEVGLGGRLDATNVVDPVISVITTLSYDHMAVLGDTLDKIATEKSGIIKPGKPVVSTPQKDEALKVIQRIAEERGSVLKLVGSDYLFSPVSHSLDGQSLFVWTAAEQPQMDEFLEGRGQPGWEPLRLNIPLLGYHQVENAATAYAALQTARQHGLKIELADIQRGFENVIWPARFEILRREPPFVIDSAHNGDSALKLRLALDDYFPGRPVVLLFGASEDKDIHGIFSALLPRVKQVIATQSIHPRALAADKIVTWVHQFGIPAQAVLPLEQALTKALEAAGDEAIVVATGSLFIAAAARQAWLISQQ